MALKLRGSSQIDNASIELEQLSNIDHGTILGRTSAGSGKPEALTASQARTELGLSTEDAVAFDSLSSTNITVGAGKSLDVSSGTLTLADDQISGDKIAGGNISGDLTLSGSQVAVSNALSAGSLSSSSAVLTGGSIDGMAIGANSHTSAKVTTIQATGNADLDGDLDVAGTTTVVALTSTGLVNASSYQSASAAITGGSIDSSVIGGNTPAAGTFTSLESSGNLVVGGNLTVNGGSTTIESASLTIEDPILQVGKDNGSDSVDLGLVGKYNDGSDNYWTGLLRDATDEKFKLFSTQEDLSSANSVDTSTENYSKGTLVSTIEGNITFDNARTFSLSGDLSGSQTFDGSGNCAITATVAADSVEFSMLGCEIDEDDMSSNSASHVPTQQSVKAYVDSQVSSGGLSDLSAKDMQMVDSTEAFIAVHEEYQFFDISSTDESNNYVTVSTEVESEFKELSGVYLNGQKLRYSSDTGTSNDYWISNTAAGATRNSNELTASDSANKDFFGTGVGLSNDGLVLAVGAGRWEGSLADQGGVYIYDWNSTNKEWDQRGSVLTAPDAGGSDRFGESTSLNSDGTILATGALLWDDEVANQGAAYVFEYSSGSWSQKGSTLSHDNPTATDLFTHVSISGNGLVLSVGIYAYDGSTGNDQGAVYVYDWNASSNDWDQRGSILLPSDPASEDYFGRDTSLSNDGSVLAVGSGAWEGDTTNQGGVYIYDWADTDNDGTADAWVQRSYGDNIISNHDLSSGDLTGWTKQSGANTTVDYQSYNGDDTIRLIPDNANTSEGTWAAVSQNVTYNFESGKTYKLKFKVQNYTNADRNIVYGIAKLSGGSFSSWLTVQNMDVDDAVPGESTSGEIELSWTADADTTSAVQIRIHHGGDPLTQEGAIYVNDFRITDEYDMIITDGDEVLETSATAASGDQFGFSAQLNSDATILAVSKYQYSNGGGDEGEVELYDWNSGTSSWDLRLTISNPYPSSSGTKNQYAFGYKLSIDGDGDVLVISERGTGYDNFAGRVQTYSISATATADKINFSSGVLDEDDKLEVRYLVKS